MFQSQKNIFNYFLNAQMSLKTLQVFFIIVLNILIISSRDVLNPFYNRAVGGITDFSCDFLIGIILHFQTDNLLIPGGKCFHKFLNTQFTGDFILKFFTFQW